MRPARKQALPEQARQGIEDRRCAVFNGFTKCVAWGLGIARTFRVRHGNCKALSLALITVSVTLSTLAGATRLCNSAQLPSQRFHPVTTRVRRPTLGIIQHSVTDAASGAPRAACSACRRCWFSQETMHRRSARPNGSRAARSFGSTARGEVSSCHVQLTVWEHRIL